MINVHNIHNYVSSLWWLIPMSLASSQTIVGLRYPMPRWFLGGGVVPPSNGVVADTIPVVAGGVQVVAS